MLRIALGHGEKTLGGTRYDVLVPPQNLGMWERSRELLLPQHLNGRFDGYGAG
jgi:hypothetical protein